jgi:hypothetical protein
MKYTEFDLQRIISDVENDFKKSLSKAENETEETEIILTKSEGYSTEEIEELSSLYAGLSKAEVEAHYEALTKHWETDTQEVMAKSENEETSLVKSENAILKSENDSLKKSMEELIAALKSSVIAPERKAITSIEYIAKSEQAPKTEVKQYSRQEAIGKLRSVIQEKALSKSDQDAVTKFTLDNTLSIDTIKHLL